MSAPKPILRLYSDGYWAWLCGCGQRSTWCFGVHRDAFRDAFNHSRTHTAERIAEELERRAFRWKSRSLWALTLRRDVSECTSAKGIAEGLDLAAGLIREHLVKEAT